MKYENKFLIRRRGNGRVDWYAGENQYGRLAQARIIPLNRLWLFLYKQKQEWRTSHDSIEAVPLTKEEYSQIRNKDVYFAGDTEMLDKF